MAYSRGENYIWPDDQGVHFWSSSGCDDWEESAWHHEWDGAIKRSHVDDDGNVIASGVYLPSDVVDRFVLLRLLDMIENNSLSDTAQNVASEYMDEYIISPEYGSLKNTADRLLMIRDKLNSLYL